MHVAGLGEGREGVMGPGEGDLAASGRESGPSITAQGTGEKLCGTFIFPVPLQPFLQGLFFLFHVPDSSVGVLWVRGRKLGQALASEDTVSPLIDHHLFEK